MFAKFRKTFAVLFSLTAVILCSCGETETRDLLAYQERDLYIDAEFAIGSDSFPAIIELDAPKYDPDGRMLARTGKLTLDKNSIISGVSFEFEGGKAYVVSGVLKIPVEDEDMISGLTDILSLFCVSSDSFCESEKAELDGASCTRAVYANGSSADAADSGNAKRVEIYIDDKTGYPLKIAASLGEKKITADINEIKAE